MKSALRPLLRSIPGYGKFRELQAEGFGNAYRRASVERNILNTRPVRTRQNGDVELRILTWRRDWLSAMWTLKTFYHFAGVDLVLHIHDGGLDEQGNAQLRRHFPDAHFHPEAETNRLIEAELSSRGFTRSLEYRRRNNHTYKLFDFYLLSEAKRTIVLDSDVLVFSRPTELLEWALNPPKRANLYNSDLKYAYALPQERMNELAGSEVRPRLNSGVGVVWRESIDFAKVERWLEHSELAHTYGVVEQTLHALCSASFGFELLSDQYLVSVTPGLPDGLAIKHYPTSPRPLLYQEGMVHLVKTGVLGEMA